VAKRIYLILFVSIIAATGAVADDAEFEGRIRLGGIVKDETGNRATMQETYNIYEGFSIPSIFLDGRFSRRSFLKLDLSDFNQDNRRGYLEYRIPSLFRLYSRYTQSAQVFDATRATESKRKNFFLSARLTPSSLTEITGDYRLIKRTGDRIGYPDSVQSWLGNGYDYDHHYGRLALQLRSDKVGGTLALDLSEIKDKVSDLNNRNGRVLSANVYLPAFLSKRLTHVLRGAVGVSDLPTSNVKYTMYTGQYTGILALLQQLQFKYRFYGSRVDDEATQLFTDNLINDFDLVYRDRWGSVSAGYGWEALDDDRSVTTYNNLRGALYLQSSGNKVSGSVAFASRDKEDKEKQTLLQDTETTRLRAKIDYNPNTEFSLGGSYATRNRSLNDISTQIEGNMANAYARYHHKFSSGIGEVGTKLSVNYQYADDDYDNRVGSYKTRSHFVTAKIDAFWNKLNLGTAVTYMDIGQDLDIEKSVLSFWGGYTFADHWEARVKYNVYNYDDYILADRFYTANIVWFDIGYNFDVK